MLLASSGGIAVDGSGAVLLIRENYGRQRYGVPGEAVDPRESPRQAVAREVEEETTILVNPIYLIGLYDVLEPDHNHRLHFAFFCQVTDGVPAVRVRGNRRGRLVPPSTTAAPNDELHSGRDPRLPRRQKGSMAEAQQNARLYTPGSSR